MGKDFIEHHELPQRMRILVADDEPEILQMNIKAFQEALRPHVGDLIVYSADSFNRLIDSALLEDPDIVVLDQNLSKDPDLWTPDSSWLEEQAQRL